MHMTFIWHYDACSRQVAWWMVALGSSTAAAPAATSSQGTLWSPWRGTRGTRGDTGTHRPASRCLIILVYKSTSTNHFAEAIHFSWKAILRVWQPKEFRWPFVCQASLRFWVNGEEKAHSFPAFSWAKGDLPVSKSTLHECWSLSKDLQDF